jgi:hypothetical protein
VFRKKKLGTYMCVVVYESHAGGAYVELNICAFQILILDCH